VIIKTNLGVRPIGGKASLGLSAALIKESELFKEYREKLFALLPINSNEKAVQYGELFNQYFPLSQEAMKIVRFNK
jgi:hypothetical protein